MADALLAAALEQVDESEHVAAGVGNRVLERVADAGLRRQMDDPVEAFGGEEPLEYRDILDVHLCEAHRGGTRRPELRGVVRRGVDAQFGQPGQLQADVVVVVERVDARDLVTFVEQPAAEVVADESGGSRNQYLHLVR